mgnify:CR=1 FL=1
MVDIEDEVIAQDLRDLAARIADIPVNPILVDLIELLGNRPGTDGVVSRNGREYDLDGNDVSTSWATSDAGRQDRTIHILAGAEFIFVARDEEGEETTVSLTVKDALAQPWDLVDLSEAMNT